MGICHIRRISVHVTVRSTQGDCDRWQSEIERALPAVESVTVHRSVFPPDMESMRIEYADGRTVEVCVPECADWDLWHAAEPAPDRPPPDVERIARIVMAALT